MKSATLALAAAAVLGAASQGHAAVTVIDFEEFAFTSPSPYGANYYGTLVSQGFEFSNSLGFNTLSIFATNHVSNAQRGGATLAAPYGGVTRVRRQDGKAFSLLSLDFADFSNDGSNQTFQLTYFDGVGQRTRTLAYDTAKGLQTADLNLSNVQWFSLNTQAQFDNIRLSDVAAVPEPATWALMILGFGSAGAMLRRRRGLAPA